VRPVTERASLYELREPGAIHAAPGEAHERSPRRKNGGGGEDEVQNKRPQPHLRRSHADPRISVVRHGHFCRSL
jgi:hypothetical protein